QANVFGTGNRVSAQLNTGSVNTVYALSFVNPYYTIDGISLGYDLYKRDVDTNSLDNVSDYQSSTLGAGVRFGFPVNERDFISLGLVYEQSSLTVTPDNLTDQVPATQYQKFVGSTGSRDDDTLRFDASWARDTRNSFLFPTKGMLQRVSSEIGTPVGSLQYYKLSYQHQQYFPLSSSFTLLLNGEVGIGGGLADEELPFFKNFFAGGSSSVRGFKPGTLGPKDFNGDAIGGDKRMVGNVELFFPLPGIKDNQSLRMSAFIDAGAAYGTGGSSSNGQSTYSDFSFNEIGVSAGLAVLWVSPLGPLKFSLAQPLVSNPGDQEEIFQFTLGNAF
ncbi:MAG: outer membrane protein assembly factor BamA, partial [Thiobacillus sp.]|nr:outer membrane protein assembly factor BamA [Thiobacillus sp.]